MPALKTPRFLAYLATLCFGIVACSAAINGLVKTRRDRNNAIELANTLGQALIPGLVVSININDVLTSGGFLAAGEVLVSLTAFFSLVGLFIAERTSHRFERRGTMYFGLAWWVFGWSWLFASSVAVLDIVHNRSAKNSASVNGVPLPDSTVQQLQAATGLSAEYWIHGYGKFQSISPWPVIFFGLISIVLTFMAVGRSDGIVDEDFESTGSPVSPVMGEKKSVA